MPEDDEEILSKRIPFQTQSIVNVTIEKMRNFPNPFERKKTLNQPYVFSLEFSFHSSYFHSEAWLEAVHACIHPHVSDGDCKWRVSFCLFFSGFRKNSDSSSTWLLFLYLLVPCVLLEGELRWSKSQIQTFRSQFAHSSSTAETLVEIEFPCNRRWIACNWYVNVNADFLF